MPTLLFAEGGAERAYELRDHNTIGRDPHSTLVLGDSRVSRRHCEVFARAGAFVLRDLRSRHGVHLHGAPLRADAMLADGDAFQVGDTVLRYVDPQRQAFDDAGFASRPGGLLELRQNNAEALAAFERSARTGDAARAALVAAFAAEDLTPPPVPDAIAPRLRELGRCFFATHPQQGPPYHVAWWVLRPAPHEDWLVVGHHGHGSNSYAWFYDLHDGLLRVTVEIPWGGVYTDPETWRRCFAETYTLLGEIVRAADDARALEVVPAGTTVSINVSYVMAQSAWRVRSLETPHGPAADGPSGEGRPMDVLSAALEWLRALRQTVR